MNGLVPVLPRNHLADRWPLPGHTALRRALERAYSAPDRGYHDLLHLTEVLSSVEELGASTPHDSTSVVLAAWFHDAVYDTEPEPERRSAQWAARALPRDLVDVDEVVRLVLLTVSHVVGDGDRNAAVLCDADLAILAAPADRYAAYVAGVRREYARFRDTEFAVGRGLVLRELLSAEHLYATTHARQHWEAGARANMASELVILDRAASGASGPPPAAG